MTETNFFKSNLIADITWNFCDFNLSQSAVVFLNDIENKIPVDNTRFEEDDTSLQFKLDVENYLNEILQINE